MSEISSADARELSHCSLLWSAFQKYEQKHFLPLDEAISSRAVFVIVSGSDGQAERFWSQLNNSKTVRDMPYMSMGS